MKILLTARNSSLFEGLYEELSRSNEVYFTSTTNKEFIKTDSSYISWQFLSKVQYDLIISIDSPNKSNLNKNFISKLIKLLKNSILINLYMRKHNKTKIILFSTVSVYGKKSEINETSYPLGIYSFYGLIKLIQEKIISFGKVKKRVTILRLPAVLNLSSKGHFPQRVISKLLKNETVMVHNAESTWNACIAFEDLLKMIQIIIKNDNFAKIYVPHAESPISIIEMVLQMKSLTNSDSSIFTVPIRKKSTGARLIHNNNIILTSTVAESIKSYCALFTKC